jgi:hypothetical protein
MPQLYWIVPLEGGRVDNSLPGGPPDHISNRPIYHPGHPEHGLPPNPAHIGGGPIYHPGHPSHGLPSQPGHPGNRPPGSGNYPSGQPVPPDVIDPPLPDDLPEPYGDKVIVAVKRPGVTEWRVTAYDVDSGIDNALPEAPEPK